MTGHPRLDRPDGWSGHWWVADDPDRVVPGVLKWVPEEGVRLFLIAGFEDRLVGPREHGHAVMEGKRTWPIILGIAEQKKISLVDCLPIRTRGSLVGDGPATQTVLAGTALVGAHLNDPDEAVFTGCRVAVADLSWWSAQSLFGGEIGMDDARVDGTGSISV